MTLYISYLLISVYVVQGIYYLYFFFLPPLDVSQIKFSKGVSVIICGHNEAHNITKNLEKFLSQSYSSFEIIFVNDRSKDESLLYLNRLCLQYTNLKIINIEETPSDWNSKKWALQSGVKYASYDYLLFSDADCWPSSKSWIETMAQGFINSDVVIGYSPYNKAKGVLNKFIQYETYISALATLGFGTKGINYGMTGRNFGVRKSTYQSFDWVQIKHLVGGDDDLLLNSLDTTTSIIYTIKSHIISTPKVSFSSYLTQKKRHLSVSNYYTLKNRLLIGAFNFTQLLFYLLIIELLFVGEEYLLAIGAYLFRTSVLFFTFVVNSKYLRIKMSLIHILWLDLLYTFFLWSWGPIALMAKKVKWR